MKIKNRITAIILSAATALSMSICAVSAETPDESVEISANQTAWIGEAGHETAQTDKLTDGLLNTQEGPNFNNNSLATYSERQYGWIVDLGVSHNITKVVAVPAIASSTYVGSQFPQQFKIQVSNDKQEWTDIYVQSTDYYEDTNLTAEEKTNIGPTQSDPPVFDNLSGSGRYVRFLGTKYPARYEKKNDVWGVYNYIQPRLAELEVYGTSSEYVGSTIERLVSSGKDGYLYKLGAATPAGNITDGILTNNDGWNIATPGTKSNSQTQYSFGWYVDLEAPTKISKVVVTPVAPETGAWRGSRFPDAYEIQVSDDADTWTTVYATDGDAYVNPNEWYNADDTTTERLNYGPTSPVEIEVAARGRYVRFEAKKLPSRYTQSNGSWNPNGYIQPAIAELEVYSEVNVVGLSAVYQSGGSTITSASQINGSVTVTATVNNAYGFDTKGVLIYALYSENRMVAAQEKTGPFEDGAALDPVTFDGLDTNADYIVKVMLWDKLTNIKPLTEFSVLE